MNRLDMEPGALIEEDSIPMVYIAVWKGIK